MNQCPFQITKLNLCLVAVLLSPALAWATLPLGNSPTPAKKAAAITQFETAFQDGRSEYGSLEDRMKLHRVPGLSMAVLVDGKLFWAKAYGVISANSKAAIDTETVFSVGSVSKLATAVITMRLWQAKHLDVDRDIHDYLKRWRIPPSRHMENTPVTLRHVLSHTAGFTIHGFPDFMPGQDLPTALETLQGKPPAKHGPVVVNFEPGSQFRYSGGGTTVQQVLIEDVTGQDFVDAAKKWVFSPLGMKRSTFLNPLPQSYGNIANAHNQAGTPVALPRGYEAMPEMAASGLWTTPSDLAKLLTALVAAYQGKSSAFLPQALVQDMVTPVEPSKFGLGPYVYEKDLVGHGGSNNSYKARVMIHLETGNGLVVLTNGRNGGVMIEEVVAAVRNMGHF